MHSKVRLASFFVPPLTVFALLYHVLADLQITVLRPETLLVIGASLGVAIALGTLAAFGGERIRIAVFSVVMVLWFDMAFGLHGVFEQLTPERRAVGARDRARIHDIAAIQAALERHIQEIGPLPTPRDYGEGMGPSDFWHNWWDVSSEDGNGDGRYFLDFLVDRGLMTSVPVDPVNHAPVDRHPTRGQHYVYFVVPAEYGYTYEGGQCAAHAGYSTYLLAVTDLEREETRPPVQVSGSGCDCLWQDKPNFFQQHFDYLVCGRFRP